MTAFRIGTSGWNYISWKNKFYPEGCPTAEWLEYYTNYFDTVELNATFYRFFKEEHFLNWYRRVPKNFKYVVKVPGFITHRKQLLDAKEQTELFCANAALLKNKLGLMLLQLSPRTPYDLDRLEEKLQIFGKASRKLVVEFRNDKWLTEDTLKLLKRYKAIFCNVDSPSIQLQTIVTSQTSYIRLHGRKKMYDYLYSDNELNEIAEQAKQLQQMGAKTIYIFFNNDINANAVDNALSLKRKLDA